MTEPRRSRAAPEPTRHRPAAREPVTAQWLTEPGRVLQVINLLLIAGLVVFLVASGADQRRIVECQGQINREFRDGLSQRAQTSSADRAAVKQLLTETLGSGTTSAQDRQALERYLTTSDQLAAQTPALPAVDRPCT